MSVSEELKRLKEQFLKQSQEREHIPSSKTEKTEGISRKNKELQTLKEQIELAIKNSEMFEKRFEEESLKHNQELENLRNEFSVKLSHLKELEQQAAFVVKKAAPYKALRGRIIGKEFKLLGQMCQVSPEILDLFDLPRGYGINNIYYIASKMKQS